MKVFYGQILLYLVLCIFVIAQEDSENLGGNYRFHENEHICKYRRQVGFCRRRSDCKKPTRRVCRFGINPVICCLDEPNPKTTTTPRPPVTTKRTTVKPDSVKDTDFTFPRLIPTMASVEDGRAKEELPEVELTDDLISNSYCMLVSDTGYERRVPLASAINAQIDRVLEQRWQALMSSAEKRRCQIDPVIVEEETTAKNSWPWTVKTE